MAAQRRAINLEVKTLRADRRQPQKEIRRPGLKKPSEWLRDADCFSGLQQAGSLEKRFDRAASRMLRAEKRPQKFEEDDPAPQLQRCRLTFGLRNNEYSSYTGPLGLWRKLFRRYFPHIFSTIAMLAKQAPLGKRDAWLNQLMKALSDFSVVKAELWKTSKPLIFLGMHVTGVRRRSNHEQIVEATRDWCQGETTWAKGQMNKRWALNWLEGFVKRWANGKARKTDERGFIEFIDDPTAWCTSGSSPAVKIEGKRYRSKWASAAWMIEKYGTVANWYDKKGNVDPKLNLDVHVTAKEQPGKVRLVLSAPIASHLRQSYLMAAMGYPLELKGTLVYRNITDDILTGWAYMSAIDASKFDHNVPFWFIENYFTFIAKYRPDLAEVALRERDTIRDCVLLADGEEVKYEKGILSGWRMTSLLDSIVSQCFAAWFQSVTQINFSLAIQGDDIIMWGEEPISRETVKWACKNWGVLLNEEVSNFGDVGEFLKYRYTYDGVIGYPARALHAIFWANPWISNEIAKNPTQLATAWNLLTSRLLPFLGKHVVGYMQQLSAIDLNQWAANGRSKTKLSDWTNFMLTPSSIGGGCPLELIPTKREQWRVVNPGYNEPAAIRHTQRFNVSEIFGAFNDNFALPKQTSLVNPLIGYPPPLAPVDYVTETRWPKGINKFKTISEWLSIKTELVGETVELSRFRFPRWLWNSSIIKKVRWLISGETYASSTPLTISTSAAAERTKYYNRNIVRYLDSRHRKAGEQTKNGIGLFLDDIVMKNSFIFHTG